MKSVVYSAPLSLYLLGEEGISFGKPALATACLPRVKITICKGNPHQKSKYIDIVDKTVAQYLVRKALPFSRTSYTWETYAENNRKIDIWTPAHYVAACGAILEFYSGRQHDAEVINRLAYEAEKQDNPHAYGVLASASAFGGLIFFRKEFAFLKGIYQLPFKIPPVIQRQLSLIVRSALITDTKKTVTFADYYSKNPKQGDRILSIMEKSVKQLTIAIAKEDAVFFKEAAMQYKRELEKALNSTMSFLHDNINPLYTVCFSGGIKNHLLTIVPFKQVHEGVKKEISL